MKKVFLLFIFTFFILYGCSKKSEEVQSFEDLINELTSPQMEGRLTGTKGNELAATLIEDKFKVIGLTPFDEQEESFTIVYPHKFYPPHQLEFQITVTAKDEEVFTFQRGIDYLERTGFQQYNKTLQFTFDKQDEQLENMFIVLQDGQDFQEVFNKAQGFLVVEEKFTRTLLIDTIGKPIIQITQEVYKQLEKIQEGQMKIESIAAEEMIEAYNIAGKIKGSKSNQAVVISAHFDHVGVVGDTIYPGAVDNASGISVLLAVAEQLAAIEKPFSKDIIFAAFNGEESGLQGSYHFVKRLQEEYEEVYNINIDSLYASPVRIVSDRNELSEELLEDLVSILKEHQLEYSTDLASGSTSDHVNFLYNHLNAVTISSQNIMDKIHIPTDTSELISMAFLQDISEALIQFIVDFDNKFYSHTHEDLPKDLSGEQQEYNLNVDEEWLKIEQAKLKYDEYQLVVNPTDEQSAHLLQHSVYTFDDLEQLKEYYPTLPYAPTIDNYKLRDINVVNDYSVDTSELEVNKVYKRDITLENLQSITFTYMLSHEIDQVLSITISKNESDREESNLFEESLHVNSKEVSLFYDLDKKYLLEFAFEEDFSGLPYIVAVRKGEETEVELQGKKVTGVQTNLSLEYMEYFVNEASVQKVVEQVIEYLSVGHT